MVSLCKEGKPQACLVHVLVAEAFIGPRPEGQVVCHSNSRKSDNFLENLRYDSQANNLSDDSTLENSPNSKLSNQDRIDIYEMYRRGLASHSQMTDHYKVGSQVIRAITRSPGVTARLYSATRSSEESWNTPLWAIALEPKDISNRLSKKDKLALLQKHKSGSTISDLAREFGIVRKNVRGLIKRHRAKQASS